MLTTEHTEMHGTKQRIERIFVTRIIYIGLFFISIISIGYSAIAAPRVRYNFNPDWKLFVGDPTGAEKPDFDDSSWKSVTMPRAWNEDDAFRKDIKDLSTGIAWYRKHFRLLAGSDGKK